jgi:hypothetical protein
MKLHVFAVYDVKAGYYATPFMLRSQGEALRGFQNECNNPQSMLNSHPADFELFQLGTFDQDSGGIEPMTPFSLGTGQQFVTPTLTPDND